MSTNDSITFVLLGAGGDLTERLLLPALGQVLRLRPELNVRLIGAARSEQDDWTGLVRRSLEDADVDPQQPAVQRMLDRTHYLPTDATDPEELEELLIGRTGVRTILYSALSPSITEEVLDALNEITVPDGVMLALEKPVGTDLASAQRINRKAERLVGADRVFRVDHFLGMAATRDLLGFRSAGGVIESLLDAGRVDAVEVVFNESIGLEGRAEFYEDTGAIVDMVQSHLLQVMAVLMVPTPDRPDDARLPERIGEVLAATTLDGEPNDAVVAGRYTAGEVDGKSIPGYLEEEGTDPDGCVETYARLRLRVNAGGWGTVPITLETGKAIGSPRQEVLVRFRPAAGESVASGSGALDSLRLAFEESAVSLRLGIGAEPGKSAVTLADVVDAPDLSAYGWVVHWLLTDNRAFSVGGRSAEEGWRIVQPALDAIAAGQIPLRDYPAGTVDPLR